MYLLYVAWADQRHRQCCICHSMTDGKARAAEPSLFQGLANSAARRQPGESQDAFASCFNPLASAKIGRSIWTLAVCDLDSLRFLPGAFESPTSTINLL